MKITVQDICRSLEEIAPLAFQESYDNAGLLIGNRNTELTGVLLCIDVTEEVISEAITKKCNMIISHHPLIFKGLKSITGKNNIEQTILVAIKNDIAIYACHTNIDAAPNGVSHKMADKLGLKNISVLEAKKDALMKLITYVPNNKLEEVRVALFEAGAGVIGNYDCCSYNSEGYGTFRGNENANPYVGEKGKLHTEGESRLEVIFPFYLKSKLTKCLLNSHPYEEPAFDLIPLANEWKNVGSGVIGDLPDEMNEKEFLLYLKKSFKLETLRYASKSSSTFKRIALCGGSGADLIKHAKSKNADAYISGDIKYHDFFLGENQMLIADIGHFESEQFTKEIFFEKLTKNFPTFAIHFSVINTNPIKYL